MKGTTTPNKLIIAADFPFFTIKGISNSIPATNKSNITPIELIPSKAINALGDDLKIYSNKSLK